MNTTQTINAACCLLLIFAIFTAQNLNAQDINPEVKVLSVLGEPLITNIIFASEVKTAKLEAIDPEKFTASDFAINIKQKQIHLSSKKPVAEPIIYLWLNLEFTDGLIIRQKLTILLPLARQNLESANKLKGNSVDVKHEVLQSQVNELKDDLNKIEKNAVNYRNIAAILAIMLLLLFWFGLRYRRKLLNINTKSYLSGKNPSSDNNDYLLQIADIYLKQKNFTEAEKLAKEVLQNGNNEQKNKAQIILDAKA